MDIASIVGLIGGIGMILGAMISGGGLSPFFDVPSVLIVFGGTFFFGHVFNPNACLSWVFWRNGQSLYAANQKAR